MTEWLVLQLYGPMASWGDIAVGEYRPSADRPARSAIIGLIAASLGVRYDEQDKLDAITKGYLISYRLEDEGIPIRDYHTTHVPSSGTGKNRRVFLTRREELMAPERDISTILSSRDYRCDVRVTVFITATVDAPFFLRDLIVPLQNPAFVLYLGRKSCPLALPLNPRVVEADSLSEACSLVPPLSLPVPGRKRSRTRVFWEDGVPSGFSELQSVIRRDEPLSRRRRQFANRLEYIGFIRGEG